MGDGVGLTIEPTTTTKWKKERDCPLRAAVKLIIHRSTDRPAFAVASSTRHFTLNDLYSLKLPTLWNGRNVRSTYRLGRRLLERSVPHFATVFVDPRAK